MKNQLLEVSPLEATIASFKAFKQEMTKHHRSEGDKLVRALRIGIGDAADLYELQEIVFLYTKRSLGGKVASWAKHLDSLI